MTTRDSKAWIGAAIGAWLGSLAVNPDLVEKMMELDKKALVSAMCQLAAIVAGFLVCVRFSPATLGCFGCLLISFSPSVSRPRLG